MARLSAVSCELSVVSRALRRHRPKFLRPARIPSGRRYGVRSLRDRGGLGEAALQIGLRPEAALRRSVAQPALRLCEGSLRRPRRAFTLAELLVSVAIMSLILITVGAVFAMSTKATGLANANNEVMSNLRAFEQQIRRDLLGIRKDAFLGLCYNYLPVRPVAPGRPEKAAVRSDWIVFFANGDFQTIADGQWWDYQAKALKGNPYGVPTPDAAPIKSNLARIEYGMLGVLDNGVSGNGNASRPLSQVELGRFAKLMIPDLNSGTSPVQKRDNPPDLSSSSTELGAFAADKSAGGLRDKNADVYENWEYEYITLSDWRNPFVWPAGSGLDLTSISYANRLVGRYDTKYPRDNLWLGLAYIDVSETLADHLRMIPGCVSFKIQRWAEMDPVRPDNNAWVPRWWPEDNERNQNPPPNWYLLPAEDTSTKPAGTGLPAGSVGFGPDVKSSAIANWPGLRIWECFNHPPIPYELTQNNQNDWPQAMSDGQRWPWIARDVTFPPNSDRKPRADYRRAIKADFPKALKITISVLDSNRRMLDKVPAVAETYNDQVPGAQTFSMIIPLE
jgi:type II secretory pathway pseudopilin PulG